MSSAVDTTTLICLFHHYDQANQALQDLTARGISADSISVMSADQSRNVGTSSLEELGVPSRDLRHLEVGLRDGGTIIAVAATTGQGAVVEKIFGAHNAKQIDEVAADETAAAAVPASAGTVIPIVEEQMQVSKRSVDQGGVRVYRRVIEVPSEAAVNLREEHVVVARKAVDRPATSAELTSQGSQSYEFTETAEEAIVSKSARVVEEVVVDKQASEHVEHIHDTVRKIEVEVEQLTPNDSRIPQTRTT